MRIDRFTWLGLAVAIVGWAVLIADLLVAEAVLKAGNLVAVTVLRADVATLAQTAILSGIGLAIIGVLRRGFRSLTIVFDEALHRAAPPRAMPLPDERIERIERPVPPMPSPIIERMPVTGQIRDRNYVILPDGSVEVDTLLGTRIFASLDEARDFIR